MGGGNGRNYPHFCTVRASVAAGNGKPLTRESVFPDPVILAKKEAYWSRLKCLADPLPVRDEAVTE
jgi:hypothetical protein